MLKDLFIGTFLGMSNDESLAELYWKEIQSAYSASDRHYHNLLHLEQLAAHLLDHRDQVTDWEAMVMALFYHDVVYNTLRQDNEAKSAVFCEKRLKKAGFPPERLELVKETIIATKGHTIHQNPDIDLFTDADLAILGSSWADYERYAKQIRQEYSIYPDFVYRPGRKKVLAHFLEMERIYKTESFHQRLETQARANLQQEFSEK